MNIDNLRQLDDAADAALVQVALAERWAQVPKGTTSTLKAAVDRNAAPDLLAAVEALERLTDHAEAYAPREDHDWRCEIRTAAAGWVEGEPPIIQCECGRDELDNEIDRARAVLRRLRGEDTTAELDRRIERFRAAARAEGRREAVATPEQLMEASAFSGAVITYQQARSILARLYDLHSHGRSSDPERAPDENAELLRRLDAWTERDNPGPLIRWAAAHLRGEAALQAADEGADR